jgi:molecular chaperone GrpE
MASDHDKGSFSTNVSDKAIADALRSVEKHTHKPAEGEVPVEVEGDSAAQVPGASSAEVDSLKAQLELSQEKGREMLAKLNEEHEKFMRTAADLENYKKRALKEKAEVQQFGIEKIVKDLLPVVDNLDRALAHAAADDPLTDGVKMVLKLLEDALARHGVKGFTALGKPFDPKIHEAMQQVPTADHPPGMVAVQHARGFLLNERLIRPAMVGVACAPKQPAGEKPPGDGQERDDG